MSQLACVWVAQKPWSHCSHSLWDSHVAHIEHGPSPGSLLLSILRVLGAPESLGTEGKGRARVRKLLWKGAKSQTLPGILLGLGKGPSCWRDVTQLCPPSAGRGSTHRGLVGSSEDTKARAGLLLGAELGSSVAQGGAEL